MVGVYGIDDYLHSVCIGAEVAAVHQAAAGVIPAVTDDTAALGAGSDGGAVHPVHSYRLPGQGDKDLAYLPVGAGLSRDKRAEGQAETN